MKKHCTGVVVPVLLHCTGVVVPVLLYCTGVVVLYRCCCTVPVFLYCTGVVVLYNASHAYSVHAQDNTEHTVMTLT